MRKLFLAFAALALSPLVANADGLSFETARGNEYISGGSVDVMEDASNDIVAAGGNVIITGNAGNEVLAAGGTVLLLGKVGGDARVAGGNVTIDNEIGGEAVIAGGRIRLLPKSTVKSDLFAAAGDIRVDGTLEGNARIIGRHVTINGVVNKDAYVKAQRLVIGKNALISGDLRYESPEEAQIEPGAMIKGMKIFTRKEPVPSHPKFLRFFLAWWIVKLFAFEAAALALYFALKKKTEQFTVLALKRYGYETFIGFIVLIVVPVAILVLFMTLVGWILGVIGLFFYFAFLFLSSILGAVVFSGVAGRYVIKKEPSITWPIILLGVFLYQIIGLIPVVGWIFKFVFFLLALGTLSHVMYLRFNERSSLI
jgi:cytoskeletal protein CcmA (bactofilin family)